VKIEEPQIKTLTTYGSEFSAPIRNAVRRATISLISKSGSYAFNRSTCNTGQMPN